MLLINMNIRIQGSCKSHAMLFDHKDNRLHRKTIQIHLLRI